MAIRAPDGANKDCRVGQLTIPPHPCNSKSNQSASSGVPLPFKSPPCWALVGSQENLFNCQHTLHGQYCFSLAWNQHFGNFGVETHSPILYKVQLIKRRDIGKVCYQFQDTGKGPLKLLFWHYCRFRWVEPISCLIYQQRDGLYLDRLKYLKRSLRQKWNAQNRVIDECFKRRRKLFDPLTS